MASNGHQTRKSMRAADALPPYILKFNWYTGVLIALFLLLLILSVLGTVAFGMLLKDKSNLKVHRYCVLMTNGNIFESAGDSTAWSNGYVEFDLRHNVMNYKFLFADIGTITAIHIHGPVTGSDAKTAAIFLPSDGSSLSITVTNSQIQDSLRLQESQGLVVVENPTNYYVLVKTQAFPSGSIGSRLGMQCNVYNT